MAGILSSLQGAVGQGVLWGIMVLGIYITFRLMASLWAAASARRW